MGGLMIMQFFEQISQKWKDHYVDQVITLGTPWGGSVLAFRTAAVGFNMNITALPLGPMKMVQQSLPTLTWLLPKEGFWTKEEPIAFVNKTKYTIEHMDQFFQ